MQERSDQFKLTVQQAVKLLSTLPPADCMMSAFTVAGMLVGGFAVAHDLPDSEIKNVFSLGQKAMREIADQCREMLSKP